MTLAGSNGRGNPAGRHRSAGFTLIEVMLAMILVGLIIASVSAASA
ncbi:prepilin-type N-terminal cleavage/methylation domain-containing protein [Pseudofulvimonas gallinarii]